MKTNKWKLDKVESFYPRSLPWLPVAKGKVRVVKKISNKGCTDG